MKIKVDDQEIFQLEEWEKKVIKNDIPAELFDEDMKRRIMYYPKHKAEQCFERMQKEWMEKLRADPSISSIPTDKAAFVEMVTSRPDYKDRSMRDEEAKIKEKKDK
jgi:hypothetical protein